MRNILMAATLAGTALLGACAYTDSVTIPENSLIIVNDEGGRVSTYQSTYQTYANKATRVLIDGECSSACTLVTAYLPPERICITPRATLGFHSTRWNDGTKTPENEVTNAWFMSAYPPAIRAWIVARGGLGDAVVYMHHQELETLYSYC